MARIHLQITGYFQPKLETDLSDYDFLKWNDPIDHLLICKCLEVFNFFLLGIWISETLENY